MEPLGTAAIFACINTAFRFAEYAGRSAEVGTENQVFVRTIQVVRGTLTETERLISIPSVRAKLLSTPAKYDWITGAMHSTKCALNEIGKWVERARGEQESTGSVKFETRVRWIFNDHEKLINRQAELNVCHQQLIIVLQYLVPLEEAVTTAQPPTYDGTTSFEDLLSPRQKRKYLIQILRPPSSKRGVNENLESPDIVDVQASILNHPPEDPRTSPNLADLVPTPLSPPPKYASVATCNDYTTEKLENRSSLKDFKSASTDDGAFVHNSQSSEGNQSKSKASTSATPEVWAHYDEQAGESIYELHEACIVASATNHGGPVNPFELFAGSAPALMHVPAQETTKSNRASSLTELLGDIYFPIELPTNDPGPPPGYPPRASSQFNLAYARSREPVWHRPATSGAQTGVQISVYELPDSVSDTASTRTFLRVPSLTSSGDSSPSNTANRYQQQRDMIAMSPSLERHRASSASAVTTTKSFSTLSPYLLPSTHARRETMSAGQLNPVRLESPSPSFRNSTGAGTSRRAATSSSRRMKTQKEIMDLLGRIDQSRD